MKTSDVIIVGAGPAGMMAAITAARAGRRVVLLEKNDSVGRKILATGNGRCNLTNVNATVDRYHGATPEFIDGILKQFTQFETMEFFESQGVALKEEERGRVFPRTNQASTIVEALVHALDEAGVEVATGVTVKSIEKNNYFIVKAEDGRSFEAPKLILATGGKAAFPLGSSGDGLYFAQKLGHNLVPIYAALAPLETQEEWVKDVQGVKVEAKVTTWDGDDKLRETSGDVLFTHFGLSGPAVMAQAGTVAPLVDDNKITIELDLYPELSEQELDDKIEVIFKASAKKSVKNALLGLFPAATCPILTKLAQVDGERKVAEISRADRLKIVRTIKALTLTIKKVRPLKEAQVSRGGVDTIEVNPLSLESKIVPGLYFAGEILDVDGDSGGFNLQWAWASGHACGVAASIM
jgi:predicted Rossmann fold flavoprotein